MNYSDLLKSDSDTDIPKEKKNKCLTLVPTSPTSARIVAQGVKSEPPKNRHPVPLLPPNKHFHRKDPSKAKPISRGNQQCTSSNEVPDSEPALDIDPPTPNDNNNQNKPVNLEVKPEGVFKTTKHGIKKHKDKRYFKCPSCGIHKSSTSKLNDHYKRHHEPLKCSKC